MEARTNPTYWHEHRGKNKAFRHVETSFVQGNQVRTDQNKPYFLLTKKQVCFDQYELDYLGRIKFLHVEMPYRDIGIIWRMVPDSPFRYGSFEYRSTI